jgi:hypothetical protein
VTQEFGKVGQCRIQNGGQILVQLWVNFSKSPHGAENDVK